VITPYQCPKCNQVHPKGCRGHAKVWDDSTPRTIIGTRPCQLPPVTGLDVCRSHGAGSPQSKAKAERARTEQAASREVARLGVKVEMHPAEALIDLVHWTAGEVAYWRDVVVQVEADGGHRALTWGVTKVKEGGDDRGTTSAAAPHIAYAMLTSASDRLAAYAAAALRAGVDERRVQLAERQGQLVADVIRGVLAALNLTAEQWELVPTIVPAQLRLLTSSTSTIGA
jgi:hypothetical protein